MVFVLEYIKKCNNINYTVLDERDSRSLLREIIDNDQIIDQEIKSLVRSKIVLILDYASTSYPFNIKKAEYFGLKQHYKIVIMYYKEYLRKKKYEIIRFTDLMVMFCDFLKTKKG